METIKKLLFTSAVCLVMNINAQTEQEINSNEFVKLIENQKTPLLNSDEELFLIDGAAWQRKYGEKEYVLAPIISNIKSYQSRIRQQDDKTSNRFKSNFYFIKVPVTELSKSIIRNAHIDIPAYVTGFVNVYLPEIDIDALLKAGIFVNYLDGYGTQIRQQQNSVQRTQSPEALIYSEDFETAASTVPGSVFSTTIAGAANCGWKDVSCYMHNGTWSAWSAGNGPACNTCGNDYVDNMDSRFWKTASINTSSYQNLVFTWWMDYDFNNTGTNDILTKYWWFGTSWVVSATSYNSSSAQDGQLWFQHTATFTGTVPVFSYLFQFTSNSVGTSFGVYIDDIQLSGTSVSTGLMESTTSSSLKVFPNPNNGEFNISSTDDATLTITNDLGQKVRTLFLTDQNKHQMKISDLSEGIYFISGNNGKEFIAEKIIVLR